MGKTYDENVKLWKEAYQNILEVCDKYPDFEKYDFRDIRDMRLSAKGHLILIDWYEKYDLKVSHEYNPCRSNCFGVGEHMIFNRFGDAQADKDSGSGKFISWPDDGRQPKDEWLFNISFPTGAYIFGDDYKYQQELFQDFITRLKSYKPDYSDTVNKSFYWKLDNAKAIFEDFNTILREYREKNKLEFNNRKAAKLREELAKLEANS